MKIDIQIDNLEMKKIKFRNYINNDCYNLPTNKRNLLLDEYVDMSKEIKKEIKRLNIIKNRRLKIKMIKLR